MREKGAGGRTARIMTLGCAKNAVDSEVMAGLLTADGWRVVEKGRADVGIVNTCGFVRDAKEESVEAILALARLKSSGRVRKLVVAGCLAGRYREKLPGLLPEVDLFVGPGDLPELPRRARELFSGTPPRDGVRRLRLPESAYRHRIAVPGAPSGYLKILEGCDNRCAYCTIPSIRGPLKSRNAGALVAEAEKLSAAGAVEINLVGQDITAYGKDRNETGALDRLVRRICALPRIAWVRLLYLYPSGVGEDLLDLLAQEAKVCRYLDIPLQHIDAEILRRMGRRYGPGDVRRRLDRIRERFPGIFLRTSVIVGFPGETKEAFGRLLRFVHEARFDYLGVFAYSREEGTRAYAMPSQVPEKVKAERLRKVRDAQADILAARNRAMEGGEIEVLVEESRGRGRAVGRHRGQAPEVDGSVLLSGYEGPPGRIVRAVVTGAREWDLKARVRAGRVPSPRVPGEGALPLPRPGGGENGPGSSLA